jgi:CO/xanthine dehydrogenase FAD-binding subunit
MGVREHERCSSAALAAGSHLRAAATLGGHLGLFRARWLQSNLVPVLAALDARIGVASLDGTRCCNP